MLPNVPTRLPWLNLPNSLVPFNWASEFRAASKLPSTLLGDNAEHMQDDDVIVKLDFTNAFNSLHCDAML